MWIVDENSTEDLPDSTRKDIADLMNALSKNQGTKEIFRRLQVTVAYGRAGAEDPNFLAAWSDEE